MKLQEQKSKLKEKSEVSKKKAKKITDLTK
jgi:hypothetical protein